MDSYEIIDLSGAPKWNDYFKKLPIDQQDTYYTPEYYKLYEELGDGKARCFIYRKDRSIAIYPFLINSVNELGYDLDKEYYDIQGAYGYNGVVTNNYSDSFSLGFHESFKQYCIDFNIIAEFTRFHPLLNNKSFSESYIEVIFDRKTMYVDLNNEFVEIFRNFQTTTRKQIRRAQNRYNIDVKYITKDESALNTFVDIYSETMKRINSAPYLYFNKTYFKTLFENPNNYCFIAYYKNKPIAAIVTLYSNNYIHGHLGGALTNYLFMAPYSLLYSEIIKFGIWKGCRYFHAGGGNTSHSDDSLLNFKANFSKDRGDFYIGKKIHNEKIYNYVINKWENKFQEKIINKRNMLLRYRL